MRKGKGRSIILAAALLAGCDDQTAAEAPIEVEMKSLEVQREQMRTFTYEDYYALFKSAAEEAESLATGNELLDKWIFRTAAEDDLLFKTDFTDEETVKYAKQQMEEHEAWKRYAEEAYGVAATDEEIDRFTEEVVLAGLNPDSEAALDDRQADSYRATADALGLTVEEFSYDFQRDMYERNVIWGELEPILREKYGNQVNLHEAYNKELAESLE